MRNRWANMIPQQAETDVSTNAAPTRMQFSLRALLATTAAIGCWFGLLRIVPHVAILLTGVFVAALSVFLMIRLRHVKVSRFSRVAVTMFTVTAWLYLYVLSIGPVIAFVKHAPIFDEEIFKFIYGPVIWLHDNTPLEKPLEQYAELWGWR